MPGPQQKHRGFTLIELAVVTAIIGLLVAGAVASFGAIRTNSKIKETHRAMHSAELLLRAFIARNGRLPCPADPDLNLNTAADAAEYGREEDSSGPGTGCNGASITQSNVFVGTLPMRDLGAEPGELLDGWGNQLKYAVVDDATLTNSLSDEFWAREWPGSGPRREIELWDKAADDSGTPSPQQVVNLGVAAIVSTGPNGNRGIKPEGTVLANPPATALAEVENYDDDVFYASAQYSEAETTPFDDLVRVFTEEDLVLPLAEMGEVQTKSDLTADRMAVIIETVYTFALSASPPILPTLVQLTAAVPDATVMNDAWGTAFIYTAVTGDLCSAPAGNTFSVGSTNTGITSNHQYAGFLNLVNATGGTLIDLGCP